MGWEEEFEAHIQRIVEERVQHLKEIVNECSDAATRLATSYWISRTKYRLYDFLNEAANQFYDSYDPKFYSRRGTLYNILFVDTDGETFEAEFREDVMTYSNGGGGGDEDDLYDLVFRRGYHGGAETGPNHPDDGTPYWRTPYKKYTRWGGMASSSQSPKYYFDSLLDNFNAEESEKIFKDEYDRCFKIECRGRGLNIK